QGRAGVEAGAAVQPQRPQRLEPQAGDVAVAPRERDVVAEDEVVLRAAVDRVVSGAADEDIATGVAIDEVVLPVLEVARLDVAERRDRGRLDPLQAGLDPRGVARAQDALEDLALVTKDHV